jgi:hypothetical protein
LASLAPPPAAFPPPSSPVLPSPGPGAKVKGESDLGTQLEAVFTQIQEFWWTSLSEDHLLVLRSPDDMFEPWNVNLISSFDQQTHSKITLCS